MLLRLVRTVRRCDRCNRPRATVRRDGIHFLCASCRRRREKIPHRLGWIIDAVAQVQRYAAASKAVYRIDGEVVPAPSLFLLCTPESWESGDIYLWAHPRLRGAEQLAGAAIAVTELYDRLLWRVGGAVLRNKHFLSNVEGGAARRYDLWT